ncbi:MULTISPECIES: DUF3786 domain-containing protein [Deferrisoma]
MAVDQPLNPEENRLYARAEDLHPAHWERLAARDPGEAARAAGARWDGGRFLLPLLGRTVAVDPSARTVGFEGDPGRPVGYQRALVAVAYLAGALEAPLRGEWVRFRDLPGGDAFFRGPHALPLPRLVEAFGAGPRGLLSAAAALGGRPVEGADAAAEVPALPRVPVRVLVWGAAGEFAPSATLLTDARSHLHLALDVLWALANVTVADLVRAGRGGEG